MSDTITETRTLTELGEAVIGELDETYRLIDIYPGQEMPADVVAAIVRGGNVWETTGGERLNDWASDELWTRGYEVVDELAKEIIARWEREDDADHSGLRGEWDYSEERDNARTEVSERDNSPWYSALVYAHGKVLLRVIIRAMDEDAGLSFTPTTPKQFLDLLGFDHTPHNLECAAEVVGNASPEYTVIMGYALLGVELSELDKLPDDEDAAIELCDPHVWLGSAFTGSGWCSEEAFTGTLMVRRGEVLTDDDAFGCSWDKVVGGADPADFGGSLRVVTPASSTPTPTTEPS
ncbi:hypothetical protein [Amycolatopsis tolypomycina]|uniref:hypothetical protein n=1 Tax=Amycolatopsis tolypomycina TaxID=208445 RepID=UPI0033ADD4F6